MKRFFIIDGFNTWYDWRLTLTAKNVPPADPKTNYVPLDGKNGTLDLTEALAGETLYNDLTLTASFSASEGNYQERERLICSIITRLHGKKVQLIEPDDPDHYLLGRVKVKRGVSHPSYHTFTIEATCEPWRYALEPTSRTVQVNGAADVVINNTGARTVCPDITVDGSVTIGFNGLTAELSDTVGKLADLRLRQGANVVHVTGNGTVTFTYTEAVR